MSVYRVSEVIGTSSTSWEDAAAEAIRIAAGTIRDLRVTEVVKQRLSSAPLTRQAYELDPSPARAARW